MPKDPNKLALRVVELATRTASVQKKKGTIKP